LEHFCTHVLVDLPHHFFLELLVFEISLEVAVFAYRFLRIVIIMVFLELAPDLDDALGVEEHCLPTDA
jgi:hypothetical protein